MFFNNFLKMFVDNKNLFNWNIRDQNRIKYREFKRKKKLSWVLSLSHAAYINENN